MEEILVIWEVSDFGNSRGWRGGGWGVNKYTLQRSNRRYCGVKCHTHGNSPVTQLLLGKVAKTELELSFLEASVAIYLWKKCCCYEKQSTKEIDALQKTLWVFLFYFLTLCQLFFVINLCLMVFFLPLQGFHTWFIPSLSRVFLFVSEGRSAALFCSYIHFSSHLIMMCRGTIFFCGKQEKKAKKEKYFNFFCPLVRDVFVTSN